MVGGLLEYSEPCFFQQILSSRNEVREGPGAPTAGRQALFIESHLRAQPGEMPVYLRTTQGYGAGHAGSPLG